jgi:UDP-N-acetylmuramate--alanine ligase
MTSLSGVINAWHIYIIGIGGAGMSPLALLLLQQGKIVSGSDQQASAVTEGLQSMGATVYHGHRAQNIAGAGLVVASAAVRADNPELVAAARQGIPAIRGAVLLGDLMRGKTAICVAGTHGKTTTSAMIATILRDAGLDPSYVIGGEPRGLPASGHHGLGEYFVAEADEYDRRFLSLHPAIAVITSIEPDHPDCYPTTESLQDAFRTFVSLLPPGGWLVGCGDDDRVWDLGRTMGARFVPYGLSARNDWTATGIAMDQDGRSSFQARHSGSAPAQVELAIPGEHNVRNALAAMAVTALAGVQEHTVRDSLAAFTGVRRRFELVGSAHGATLVDDYAHHPTEIRATLAAARARYPGRRIVAVPQPHTYSRLKALLPDVAAAFGDADQILIVDIYPSRETDALGVHSRDLVAAMGRSDQERAAYAGGVDEATEYLARTLRPGDVLITLGAGDVNRILHHLMTCSQSDRQID